ncbi:NHLP leader peptide family RiPP precursor [Cohnella silvisoli]|uniref:NHLP leader peptide family RiPP n=1 Tax=Cohnella silvisoli TaxID=2873699 RepID=A0ABV1KNX6_9BACL|nr:NHLP leader peptide family RiPP precursor [Cohnella silvisoli]MCD9020934.1 NHLP leader peptide family RiPP precursor [Cohnella silvisoli]
MSLESLKVQIIKKAWAEPAFKQSLLADPKGAITAAFGIELPGDIELKVVEETPALYYLTIPPNPEDIGTGTPSPNAVW